MSGPIGLRTDLRVKSGTTPITSEGLKGGSCCPPGPAQAALQRSQLTVLPTASRGDLNPSIRAPVSLSMIEGWFAAPSPSLSSTMSWPRPGSKRRPASGLRPCISKKPTSTALRFADIRGWPGHTAPLVSAPPATTDCEAQATCRTPGRAATSCFMAGSQGALILRIWSVSRRTASFKAKAVCR